MEIHKQRSSCLSTQEKNIFLAIAKAVIPAPPEGELSHEEAGTVDFIDEHLALASLDVQVSFRLVLFIFEWFPILLSFVPGRFSKIPPDMRHRVVTDIEHSRFYLKRITLRMLSAMCLLGYYSRPVVHDRMNFARRLG